MTTAGKVRRLALGIPSEEAVFKRPGFAPEAWERFAPVASSLVEGYNASLEESGLPGLVTRLDAIDRQLQGFAYEGAAMGLAALDVVAPWRRRVDELVEGPGAAHVYPIYVGIGLALARLHRNPEAHLRRLDPILGWVVVDGYGFHEGFFRQRRYLAHHAVPHHLSRYGRRLFDQGLGRAIWFSRGAVVDRVAATVGGFQAPRHADLWSGIALACSYAGGADRAAVERLATVAAAYPAELARGAAVAAWGRRAAGNMADHTELACEIFCGLDATTAAADVEQHRLDLPPVPAYERWRTHLGGRSVA